jgi:phage virion morphogenesis protein
VSLLAVQFNIGRSRTAIQEALSQLDDMTPIFSDIGEYMIEATRQRFVDGKAPDGSAWAPKKESTLERYRRLGYGSLTRPLIGPARALSRQIQKIVAKGSVTIGSSLIYSAVMQEGAAKGAFGTDQRGSPIPWGTIAARVWLGISNEDETAIVAIVDEHLQSKLLPGFGS